MFETTERIIVVYLIACGCLSIKQKRNGSKVIFLFNMAEVQDRIAEYKSGKPAMVDYRMVVYAEDWFNTIIHEI